MPRSRWPFLLAFVTVIAVIYAIKGYRALEKPKSGDALVLLQLRATGSDLSKPHSIEFFIYLPTREAGKTLLIRFERRALVRESIEQARARIGYASAPNRWCLISRRSRRLEQISTRLLGLWGANTTAGKRPS